jgi:hypothetical protein
MEAEVSLPHSQLPANCLYPEPTQSIPYPEDPSQYYAPIYTWVSPVVSFPPVSPPNPVYASPLSIRAMCPAHLILLDFITRKILGEDYRSLSSSLWSFLHFPVTSSLLCSNILLNTIFSNTLNLRFSVNFSDQVSQLHKTTGKIIGLYILI